MPISVSVFLDSLDIANKACQHLGVRRIASIDENSAANLAIAFAYDKLRQIELRRNVWRFAKRVAFLRPIDDDTRLLDPADWDENTLYLPGSIVRHTNGTIWFSNAVNNSGNEPGVSSVWEHYFGPSTVHLYDEDTAYNAGELVYMLVDDYPGAYIVYLSTANENEDEPNTATEWDADVTYKVNDRVSYNGLNWRSLISINYNCTPMAIPVTWNANVEYAASDQVVAEDGFIWTAQGTTTGDNPVSDDGTNWINTLVPAAWDSEPELPTGALTWYPLYCGLENLDLEYMTIKGNTAGANIFRLPAGWLRSARPDGGRTTLPTDDTILYGDYMKSSNGTFTLDFVADITDVRRMDPMFCEGLACRIASDVAEELTGSNSVEANMATRYARFMGEARIVNAIESGPDMPDEDDLISVRRRPV
jgi:hypothetical protein